MQDDIRSQIEQGKFLFRTREFKKAEEILHKVLEKKKDFADVHNVLGLIYNEEGLYDRAVLAFEKALKINPRYTEAMLNLSILYNGLGEYEKAKKLVTKSKNDAKRKSAAIDPFIRSKLANKHAEVGDWYAGVGEFKRAVEEYLKALDLEEKYVDIRTRLAVAYREIGDLKSAQEHLKKALHDNDHFTAAHVQLGVTYYAAGKKTEARKVWKDAAKKFPKDKTLSMYLHFTD